MTSDILRGTLPPITTPNTTDYDEGPEVEEDEDSCRRSRAFFYEDLTQLAPVRVTFVLAYTLIIVTAVAGNAMVVWTIAANRHMRTVTNLYLLNLAAADSLVAVVVMPLKLIEYNAPCRWGVLGNPGVCPLLYYVLPVFVFTSVLTLAAISVER